jgi:hypothetical protein
MASTTVRRVKPQPAGTGIKAPRGPLDIEIIPAVGSDLAQSWLERNHANRSMRRRKVLEFRRDMISGNWREIGDAIRFDTSDRLIDGQHRLQALVEADTEMPGLALPFLVVRGVAPEDRMVIDTGTRRSAADQLRIAGYTNYTLLSAAAKWCLLYDRRILYAEASMKSVTHAEILDYVTTHPDLQDICAIVGARMVKKIDMPAGYIATSYYLCSRMHRKQADDFFDQAASGVNLSAGDPVLALRNRLHDLARNRANLSGDMWLSLAFRAWNARRKGVSLRSLPVDKGGVGIPAPQLV